MLSNTASLGSYCPRFRRQQILEEEMTKLNLTNTAGAFTEEERLALLHTDLCSSYITDGTGQPTKVLHHCDRNIEAGVKMVDLVLFCQKNQSPSIETLSRPMRKELGGHYTYFPQYPKAWQMPIEKLKAVLFYEFNKDMMLGPEITAFLQVRDSFAAVELESLSGQPQYTLEDCQQHIELLLCFFKKLTKIVSTKAYRKKIRARSRNKNQKVNQCTRLFLALIAKHSKLLVIRIDLALKRSQETLFKRLQTIKQIHSPHDLLFMKEKVRQFKSNWRHDKLLNEIVGYIFQYEHTPATGYHLHGYLFYDANKHQQDMTLGKYIAKYWEKTTDGLGSAFICNMKKHEYKYCAIGEIHHADVEKQQFLIKTFDYIAKSDQFFMLAELKKFRTFQCSQLPALKSKAGRPRKGSQSLDQASSVNKNGGEQ